MPTDYKNIAQVLRTHGTKGEVIVAALRGLPFLLTEGMRVALTPPALDRDRFCTCLSVTPMGDGALVSFSGIESLDDAEHIAGCTVLAQTADLDMGRLDSAVDDLIGRAVRDERFGDLGSIVEVMLTPANDVWVVDGGAYGEVLIPVIDQVVVDLPETGAISVHVMDGLIDVDA